MILITYTMHLYKNYIKHQIISPIFYYSNINNINNNFIQYLYNNFNDYKNLLNLLYLELYDLYKINNFSSDMYNKKIHNIENIISKLENIENYNIENYNKLHKNNTTNCFNTELFNKHDMSIIKLSKNIKINDNDYIIMSNELKLNMKLSKYIKLNNIIESHHKNRRTFLTTKLIQIRKLYDIPNFNK